MKANRPNQNLILESVDVLVALGILASAHTLASWFLLYIPIHIMLARVSTRNLKAVQTLNSFSSGFFRVMPAIIFCSPGWIFPSAILVIAYLGFSRRFLLGAPVFNGELALNNQPRPQTWNGSLDRAFDLLGASCLLLISAPLLALILLVQLALLRGSAFFVQKRVGKKAVPLWIWKFRTLTEHPSVWFSFLRKSGLDELPQLFNILKGEMSIVGPRPELVELDRNFDLKARRRYHVRPGLTGLWQLSPYRSLPISEHVELDLFYVDIKNPWNDLMIVFMTPFFLLGTKK